MSNDDDVFICYEHFWCQYAHLPIAIAGLVGNLTSGAIFLLSQDFKERPLIKVLVTLAIVDSLYLVTTTDVWVHFVNFNVLVVLEMVSGASHTASVYLTLTISYDRYMAICRPFSQECMGQRLQIVLVLAIAVSLSPLFLPPWLQHLYLPMNWTTSLVGVAAILKALLEILLPFMAISALSLLVSRELKSADAKWASSPSMQRRDSSAVTKLLMTIVTLFLLCHVLSVINTILTAFFYFSEEREEQDLLDMVWANLLTLSESFQMLNSSCNFVIYAARDRNFRTVLKSTLQSALVRRSSKNTAGQTEKTSNMPC